MSLKATELLYGLGTRCFGQRVFIHQELDSTNDEARSLAEQGAPEGTLVMAELQRAGRGRRGRAWHSPAGTGLWCSLVVRPPASIPPGLVALLLGVAIARPIQQCCGAPACLKWPNDVLIRGLKVAGILCEASGAGLVAGFGVNVNQREFPPHLPGATSIYLQTGRQADRALLLREILQEAERLYSGGPERILEQATSLLSTLGRRVLVQTESGALQGRACGLEADGALLLQEEGAARRRVRAGDVLHLDQEGA